MLFEAFFIDYWHIISIKNSLYMNIIKNRFIFMALSWVVLLISLFLLVFSHLNLWIEMTWGIKMEYDYTNTLNIEDLQNQLVNISDEILLDWEWVMNSTSVYKITGQSSIAIVGGFATGIDDVTLDDLKNEFRSKTLALLQSKDDTILETKYINIWKSFGDYIKSTAFLTLWLAIIGITIYVSWAFSWVVGGIKVASFAVITIITLFHDVIISAGLYVLAGRFFPEFQIDTFFITALLTILGYSINDTIVVFDRIRANLKAFWGKKWKDSKKLEEIVQLSIGETITRSIYTSLTLLFVLITVFLFGPETIKGFILVMIFGTIIGTYSSIFIASPILYQVNKNTKLTIYKKKVVQPEDKIVV